MDTIERISLSTGSFSARELELIFRNLPFEVSFVGPDDTVRFFSDKPAEEKLFMRSKAAIGKDLHVCHPKKYIPMMESLIQAFKDGEQSHARFWRQDHQGKFVTVDYFALREEDGTYQGALEVVQDITVQRSLEGDRHEVLWL